MAKRKTSSFHVLLFGYSVFILAIIGGLIDFAQRYVMSLRMDVGVLFGESAFAVTGLLAITAGHCLKGIEKRLDQLERGRGFDRN